MAAELGGVLGVVLNVTNNHSTVSRRAKQQSADAENRTRTLIEALAVCTQSRDDEKSRVATLEQQVADLQHQLDAEKLARATESTRYAVSEADAKAQIEELSTQLTAADQVFQELVQESVALLQRLPVNRAEAKMTAAADEQSSADALQDASVEQLRALVADLQSLKAAEAAQAAESMAGLTNQLRQQTTGFAVQLRKAQASAQPQSCLEKRDQLKLLGTVLRYVSANVAK